MANYDITHPPLWGILHVPSNKLLRQFNQGYGHTQLPVEDEPGSPRASRGAVLSPRLFTSEDTAKRALLQWLQGEHRNEWEDGLIVYRPDVPRYKEDMKVVPIYLYSECKEDEQSV